MTDAHTLKDPRVFFKSSEKHKSGQELSEKARAMQKYKQQMKQLRDREK